MQTSAPEGQMPAALGNQEWLRLLGIHAKLTVSQPGDENERGNLSSSRGTALPNATRGMYERFFGTDLSRVRVHNGEQVGAAARTLNARAFTQGYNIYFSAGEYAPHDPMRRRLLAHELAHVVQQKGAEPQAGSPLRLTQPGDTAERSADEASDAIARGDMPRALPSTGIVIARGPDDKPGAAPPVPSRTPPRKHIDREVDVENGSIVETFDFYMRTDELGRPRRQRLDYARTVTVKIEGELWAELSIKGVLELPLPIPSAADPADLIGMPGTASFDAFVRAVDKRGAMANWHGFEFTAHRDSGGYPPQNDYTPLWTLAASGPEYVHYGLTAQRQVDALIEEVRKRLPPPRKPKSTDVTEEEFERMTPEERADLARDALAAEFKWSNVLKGVAIGVVVAAAALGAVALASVGGTALAIGLAIAAIAAGLLALFLSLWDTISDALARFADNDVGGAILKILGGLAALGALIVGTVAVVAAILGAPLEVAGALLLAGVALVFRLLLAYHDYDRAKTAPDLAHFRHDIGQAARGFEGSISDAVTAFLAALVGGARRPGKGPAPPPDEPVIIEPPRIVPAPPEIEIPQVAPAAPPVPEVPQVAGPSVMVPNVRPPDVVDLPPIPRVLQLPRWMRRLPQYMRRDRMMNPPAIDPDRTSRMRDALRAQRAQPNVPGRVDPPGSPGVAVQGGTRAVAQTDIPALAGEDFSGASPRAMAPGQRGTPGTTGGTVLRPAYPRAQDHAEHVAIENVRVALEEGLARPPGEPGAISRADLQGRTVFVLVEQEPCSSCAAGTGVLQQFSALFPELIIEVRSLRSNRAYIYGGGMLLNP